MNMIMINKQRIGRDTPPCQDCPDRECCEFLKSFEAAKNEEIKKERDPVDDRDVPSYRHAEIF